MELSTEFSVRYVQSGNLHDGCFARHAQLQTKYEIKNLEMIEYKTKANFWETQFHRVKAREDELITENEELKAKLRKREQQLFGKSSEKNNKTPDVNPQLVNGKSSKNRGQQPGSKGHGRRDYSHLPIVEEEVGLAEESCHCPCCHVPYEELPIYSESDILEIVNVKAHRRVIYRKNISVIVFAKKILILRY